VTDIEDEPASGDAPQVVTVEIMGQRFLIRSSLDIEYINRLASYVDHKIQAATEHSTGGDTVRITVLAAMNIADEYFRSRDTETSLELAVKTRAGEIERMVDDALADGAPESPTET
jgi:cell division protein ZapA